jgi:zinc-binding alcohol dehydrogenase family protein
MKAIGYKTAGDILRPDALLDIEVPLPLPSPNDLRVKISAVSVNPVDTKIRKNRSPKPDIPEILGWDAVGVVDALGEQVEGFKHGDRVYYAGAINRPGTNAQYHIVDYRIVGHAPKNISDAQAAALPLTSITAWELLFDRLGLQQGQGQGKSLLVIGGAGGVGSILIQLAKQLTKLKVIATASRPESYKWCSDLGAHHVIDHSKPFAAQLQKIGVPQIDMVAALTQTDTHWASIVEVMLPQGRIAVIDDPAGGLNVMALKAKSLSLHWELMFTRSLFQTSDMHEQGKLLNRVAALIDSEQLRSTLTQTMSPINAQNLRDAHALIESGRMQGKIVLQGF